jgi:hypothetical protein
VVKTAEGLEEPGRHLRWIIVTSTVMQCKGNGTKAVSSVLTPQEVENLPLHQIGD